MAGLLDIAPLTASVVVRGNPVEVRGVSAKGIAHLLARFPELRALMAGKEVAFEDLLRLGGDAVASIIAAGIGSPGDAAQEAAAEGLSLDEQAELLTAILKLTMPGGVGPFVEKVTAMAASLGSPGAVAIPGSKSPKP